MTAASDRQRKACAADSCRVPIPLHFISTQDGGGASLVDARSALLPTTDGWWAVQVFGGTAMVESSAAIIDSVDFPGWGKGGC